MKTPEELAEKYGNRVPKNTFDIFDVEIAFLAGYKAAKDQLADADKVIIPQENCEAALKAMQSAQDLSEQAIRWMRTLPPASERCNQCACEGYRAGYKAAQEHAHAALEEAEARIQELRDQLMEESGGRLKLFKNDADAKAAYQECLEEIELDKAYRQGLVDGAPQWISVNERLPEIGEWVLINGSEVCQRVVPPSSNWDWEFAWATDHQSFYEPTDITHWMPLPEPPKEENE